MGGSRPPLSALSTNKTSNASVARTLLSKIKYTKGWQWGGKTSHKPPLCHELNKNNQHRKMNNTGQDLKPVPNGEYHNIKGSCGWNNTNAGQYVFTKTTRRVSDRDCHAEAEPPRRTIARSDSPSRREAHTNNNI